MNVGAGHTYIQDHGQTNVHYDVLEGVLDRVLFLTDYVGQDHRGSVAGETGPGAGHITELRDEHNIHSEQHEASDSGEQRTPKCLVCKLVPERKVEIDSHHDLSGHHDRHDLEALPIAWTDDVFQDIHIPYDAKERKEGEYDEVLHRLGVHLLAVL